MEPLLISLLVSLGKVTAVVFGMLFTMLALIAAVNRLTSTSAKAGEYMIRVKYAYISENGSPRLGHLYHTGSGLTASKQAASYYMTHAGAMQEYDRINIEKRYFGGHHSEIEILEKINYPIFGEEWKAVNKKVA